MYHRIVHRIVHRKIGLVFAIACLSLLPLSAAAQQLQQKPCLKLKEKVYSLDAVRQGDFYDVTLRFEAHGCVLGVSPEFTPLQAAWHTEPNSGLQADEQAFVGRPLEDDNAYSRELSLTLRVTVPNDAQAGKHTIQGVLNYEALGPWGSQQEQLSLQLPVKVVPAGANVHARRVDADGEMKWYQVLLLIVTFPVAFVIYAVNEC